VRGKEYFSSRRIDFIAKPGIPVLNLTHVTRIEVFLAVVAAVIGAAFAYWMAGVQWVTLPIALLVAAGAYKLLRDRLSTSASRSTP
jgi:hypothetical protein